MEKVGLRVEGEGN